MRFERIRKAGVRQAAYLMVVDDEEMALDDAARGLGPAGLEHVEDALTGKVEARRDDGPPIVGAGPIGAGVAVPGYRPGTETAGGGGRHEVAWTMPRTLPGAAPFVATDPRSKQALEVGFLGRVNPFAGAIARFAPPSSDVAVRPSANTDTCLPPVLHE